MFLITAATDQSLDVVSDVLGSFLERFSTVLKKNLENEQRMCKEGVDPSMDVSCLATLTVDHVTVDHVICC